MKLRSRILVAMALGTLAMLAAAPCNAREKLEKGETSLSCAVGLKDS